MYVNAIHLFFIKGKIKITLNFYMKNLLISDNLNTSNNKFRNSKFSEMIFFGSTMLLLLQLAGVIYLITSIKVGESSLSNKLLIFLSSNYYGVTSNYLNSEF